MRARPAASLAALLAFAASASPAGAILIRHDRADARYVELGARYPSVCRVMTRLGPGRDLSGEGTLIRPGWVITAAHVVQSPLMRSGRRVVVCGGEEYGIAREVSHPRWSRGDLRDDVALIRLDREVRGIRPVPEYTGRDEAGKVAVFVGAGVTGTGLTGPRTRNRTVRGATNRIERADGSMIYFVFDAPGSRGATDLEGVSGPGDSGGPGFVAAGGRTYVAGISAWGDDRSGDGITGTYGDLEGYTRVSTYAGWIREVVGER